MTDEQKIKQLKDKQIVCFLDNVTPKIIGIINKHIPFIQGYYFQRYEYLNTEIHNIYIHDIKNIRKATKKEIKFYEYWNDIRKYNL